MASGISPSLIGAALRRVPGHELPSLLAFLAGLEAAALSGCESDGSLYLAILRRNDASPALKTAAGLIQHRCREAYKSQDGGRGSPVCEELAAFTAQVQALIASKASAGDSRPLMPDAGALLMPALADGRFIQLAHEVMLGRGCQPHELLRWQARLSRHEVSREGALGELLQEATRVAEQDAARRTDPEASFHVMGTGQRVTLSDWQLRAGALPSPVEGATVYPQRFHIKSRPRVLISALTSLYKGGAHIERFMENIVGQSCFCEHAELIIVDADSPDDESAVIQRYMQQVPNIKYLRINHRIGVYDAWNIAVKAAAGDYLTNANVDDIRRHDSFEQQAAVLDNLPFVDVVYQDFYYSLDPTLSFEQVAAFGYKSDLPLVTPHGLMALNPPHNAPMWRRRLHDELGPFDARFESAGDYDFWMRCVIAGKTFFKLNDAHVAYFQNPQGLSTRPDTKGHEETRAIHKRYGRQLVSDNLVMPLDNFRTQCLAGLLEASDTATQDRPALVHRALTAAAVAAKRAASR